MGKEQEPPTSWVFEELHVEVPVLQSSRLGAAPGTQTHSLPTCNISWAMYKLTTRPPPRCKGCANPPSLICSSFCGSLLSTVWKAEYQSICTAANFTASSCLHYSLLTAMCCTGPRCPAPHLTPLHAAEVCTGIAAQTLLWAQRQRSYLQLHPLMSLCCVKN